MNQQAKNKLIDAFVQLLEESNSKSIAREYSKILNTIQKQTLSLLEIQGDITRKDIRNIINANPFPSTMYNKAIIKSYIGSGVTLLMENQNLTQRELQTVAPIVGLIKITGLHPVRIVNRIEQWSDKIIRGGEVVGKYKGAIISLQEYVGKTNAKQITDITRKWNNEVKTLNRKLTTQLSQDMYSDLRKLQKSTTIFDQQGNRLETRRPLTQEEINTRLQKKYRTAHNRVERIIRTEVHAQNELVRQVDARTKGYNKKRWINEGDNKVRQSHKGELLQQRPEVNEPFILTNTRTGKRSKAMYAGDPNLPVEERVNCRCTNAYAK